MMGPPFEEGVCSDLIRVVSEDTATLGKNLIEFLEGLGYCPGSPFKKAVDAGLGI